MKLFKVILLFLKTNFLLIFNFLEIRKNLGWISNEGNNTQQLPQ